MEDKKQLSEEVMKKLIEADQTIKEFENDKSIEKIIEFCDANKVSKASDISKLVLKLQKVVPFKYLSSCDNVVQAIGTWIEKNPEEAKANL